MKLQTIERDYPKALDEFLKFVWGNIDNITEGEADKEELNAYEFIENNLTDIFGDINLRVLLEFFDSQGVLIEFVAPYIGPAENARFAYNIFCESPSLSKVSRDILSRHKSIEQGFKNAFDFLEFQKLT